MARRRRSPEIVAGRVNADGSIAAGDGFTVAKAGTGLYDITFGAGFRLLSIVPVVSNGNTRIPSTLNYTERSVRVSLFTTAVAAVDDPFSFTAVGVQQ